MIRVVLVGPLAKSAEVRRWVRASDRVIAVDGGLDVCARSRVKPSFAVGDWDSLKNRRLLGKVEYLSLPAKKDRSDLSFALEASRYAGARELLALGFMGGKQDYQLANLYDLAHARIPLVSARDGGTQYHFLSPWGASRIRLKTRKGQRISILPLLGEAASGVSLRGLEYPLQNARLECSSQGLSNRASGSLAEVAVKKGCLVVIVDSESQ